MTELSFTEIKKVKGSLYVRLPDDFIRRHNLKSGDTLVMEKSNMFIQLITTKVKARRDALLETIDELDHELRDRGCVKNE